MERISMRLDTLVLAIISPLPVMIRDSATLNAGDRVH